MKAREKVLAGLLSVGVAAVPTWFSLRQAHSLQDETGEVRSHTEATRARIATASAADVAELRSQRTELADAMPELPEIAEALDQIDEAALAAGMQLRSGTPTSGGTDGSGPSWQINITAEGPTEAVPELLGRLAGIDRLVVIDSVTVTGAGALAEDPAAEAGEVTVTVALRVFTQA